MSTQHEKHTPGPWKRDDLTIYALHHSGWRKGVEQLENRFTASIHRSPSCTEGETQANARLIAAAPELLEALAGLIDTVQRFYDDPDNELPDAAQMAEARAAMAAAKGEA